MAFHEVYNVSPNSTTYRIKGFFNGVWGIAPPLISLLLLTVVYVADLTPCWCSSIPSALVQNVLKML